MLQDSFWCCQSSLLGGVGMEQCFAGAGQGTEGNLPEIWMLTWGQSHVTTAEPQCQQSKVFFSAKGNYFHWVGRGNLTSPPPHSPTEKQVQLATPSWKDLSTCSALGEEQISLPTPRVSFRANSDINISLPVKITAGLAWAAGTRQNNSDFPYSCWQPARKRDILV